ncbi:hypothetical protein [Corallococcus sp. CA053C]|uniref:hypothetical protein n=1 Tax=Corallococcus sp. CA053C TaxID=2316732 RepID=UPI0013154714|nr:hypothetical protein [Corallococcus sp. CA053C]
MAERVLEFERAGVDLLLLRCSPQIDEREHFSRVVMPRGRDARHAARYVPAA